MLNIKRLTSVDKARKIVSFLLSDNAFQQTWAPGEAKIVKNSVLNSLKGKNHVYWYIEDKGKIIGVLGIRENTLKSGGYVMIDDYMAVHKDFRRQGLGTKLIDEAEKYVRNKKGRYILVETCDIDSYKPARAFYEKMAIN